MKRHEVQYEEASRSMIEIAMSLGVPFGLKVFMDQSKFYRD